MIEYDKIGSRIKEQRKYILKRSQEKMAEDLGMYQADISNLEKRGTADLDKLERIADYFDIPLETLLFGKETKNMKKYYGDTMALKESHGAMRASHRKALRRMAGQWGMAGASVYECGPYTIYNVTELVRDYGGRYDMENGTMTSGFSVPRLRTCVFLDSEVVAVMTTDVTDVMQHVYIPALQKLQELLPQKVLDVTDVWRTLNPYVVFWKFSKTEEEAMKHAPKMTARMDALRGAGEDRPVLYVENVYVREDCRRNGIFRMYVDMLKQLYQGCIIWLNMAPLENDWTDSMNKGKFGAANGAAARDGFQPEQRPLVAGVGQISLNAVIAEKMGFTVDPDDWGVETETMDADGNVVVEKVRVRKCAYYLPQEIRDIIADDGNLVDQGRALQTLRLNEEKEKKKPRPMTPSYFLNKWMRGEDV